jgi:hypothetical protein
MMDINEKLLKIQLELKVPKSANNKFGGYKYRTVDMILEKVKPLADKNKAVLILHDDLVQIGDRYYVKATASLLDLESDKYIAVSAWAREQLERKKSDESQLTGAASTYARKYALNGLFLLDDTADPDSYAGAPEDDDPAELDRQEAEEQEKKEEEPARRRPRSRKKREESIEDYVNPPETPDGSEELPFSEEDKKLTEDKYYFIEKDGNYIMKHAGEYPPEGGKEITKDEFVKGSAEIATGKKRTRRVRKARD